MPSLLFSHESNIFSWRAVLRLTSLPVLHFAEVITWTLQTISHVCSFVKVICRGDGDSLKVTLTQWTHFTL